jgi:xanthine/CO dehydrogenase XdhC/CoxF family maturation factor
MLPDGPTVHVDGINKERRLVCEVYAHIGRMRGAQNHKVAHDILKLWAIGQCCGGDWRKLLCFVDKEARRAVVNNSWLAWVCHCIGIEIELVPLSRGLHDAVSKAQQRQFMMNRRKPGA